MNYELYSSLNHIHQHCTINHGSNIVINLHVMFLKNHSDDRPSPQVPCSAGHAFEGHEEDDQRSEGHGRQGWGGGR